MHADGVPDILSPEVLISTICSNQKPTPTGVKLLQAHGLPFFHRIRVGKS
jgi:hypothetical protein